MLSPWFTRLPPQRKLDAFDRSGGRCTRGSSYARWLRAGARTVTPNWLQASGADSMVLH